MYGDLKQMVKQAKEEAELRAKQKDIIEMSVAELQIEVATLRERCAQLEIRLLEKQPQPYGPSIVPPGGMPYGPLNPYTKPCVTCSSENIKCSNGTNEYGEPNVK